MAVIIRGKNARKKYTVRWTHEGKQYEQSFATMREATDWRIKVEHDMRARIFTPPAQANIRFEDAASAWLARHTGTPRTLEIYETALRRYINPAIGKLSLAKVADGRELIEDLTKVKLPVAGIGPSYVRDCYMIINAVVNDAIKSGRLSQSRIRGIRLPVVPVKAEIPFASHEQIRAMAGAMTPPHDWTVYLMRGCGLRLGEALAVGDGDITDGTLRLARQLAPNGRDFIPLKHRGDGDYRDIPAPRYVIEAQPSTFPYDAPVPHWKYRAWFNRARDKAGLPPELTPHTLRHIFASSCLAGGIPITDVSKWLGHQNIQVTFGIYGHLVPASWERARAVLDEEWKS